MAPCRIGESPGYLQRRIRGWARVKNNFKARRGRKCKDVRGDGVDRTVKLGVEGSVVSRDVSGESLGHLVGPNTVESKGMVDQRLLLQKTGAGGRTR